MNLSVFCQGAADFDYIDVWSSKSTWGGKDPPAKGEMVVVPKGQILLLDTNTPVLKMLLIKGIESMNQCNVSKIAVHYVLFRQCYSSLGTTDTFMACDMQLKIVTISMFSFIN